MNVVVVKELKKSFRPHFYSQRVEVLQGLTFNVKKGSVTGFLGANGSGKTTTIKCLLNLIFPDSGQIELLGQRKITLTVKQRIGFLPERPYFYEHLTGREFLQFYGRLSRLTGSLEKKIDEILGKVSLLPAKNKELRNYSKGMLQRIGIAQALIHDPEFIILDEPMTGLDPDGRVEVSNIINEVAKQGTSVFFSSHLLHDVEKLCDELVILKSGSVVYQGSTKELIGRVKGRYIVVYNEGQLRASEICEDLREVQESIDQIRSRGQEVVEIRKDGGSLEEIFVDLAF